MLGINKVILVGNTGKDPEMRHLESGRACAKLTLATQERYKNREGERVEKTEWHNLVFWSPLAEIVEQYVQKGSKLYIEGKIRTRSYEDKQGEQRYITEVEVREMIMLDSRREGQTISPSTEAKAPEPPIEEDADDLPF